ncbi:MAG: twitching motility protein [Lentisphaerae bacterium GWF2_52_8]|nr:MAG: twitching motility protein [Lentisphaerae bacterium GWF2_52_8]
MGENMLHDMLDMAVSSKASDVHIKEGHSVTLRIEGSLVDTDYVPDSDFMKAIIRGMASPEQEKRYYESGDLDLSFVAENVGRFRVNIHRQRGSHGITMRHVKSNIMNFEQLGVPGVLEQIAEAPRGIIIVCGTTGSGKSTTLAAMLEHLNLKHRRHILTIEDPIEYEFFDKQSIFEQREVGLDTPTFSSALIHALRQDPDIIMVGEMRDRQSFEGALQAADTGHVVMTTLHSTTASQAINRILDFFSKGEQDSIREALALNIKAIIAQRLMPRAFGGGVIPAVEIMINSPIIRKLIQENRLDKLAQAIEGGREDGMQSFNQSLLTLVNEGQISEEDALIAATNPEALKMNLQGIFLNTDNQILG